MELTLNVSSVVVYSSMHDYHSFSNYWIKQHPKVIR